jgi:adenylate cyclase
VSVRIPRAFAFVDLCGFTAHMDASGDDAAAAALTAMRSAVRHATERHGVRVAKWLGDGCMLVAVETASLLDCLDQIWSALPQRTDLPVRGGMASGEVLIFEGDDYVGRPVNFAARLCSIADPGQLLATEDCDPRSGDHTEPVQVRGVATPLNVVELRATAPRR